MSLKQRDEFIAIASHELKTPLTSMKVYAQIVVESLRKNSLDQEADFVKRISAQVDRLNLLPRHILGKNKIAQGKLPYQFEQCDISLLLKERIEEIRLTTSHKFIIQIDSLRGATIDKERIGQGCC